MSQWVTPGQPQQTHLCPSHSSADDDYSEEEEEEEDEDEDDEDDEEEEEYDGEIPQPELEPRSRRCLIGDPGISPGICVIPDGNHSSGEEEEEEDEEEEEEDPGRDQHGDNSDSDGPVLYKDEDSDEEDEPPMSEYPSVGISVAPRIEGCVREEAAVCCPVVPCVPAQ